MKNFILITAILLQTVVSFGTPNWTVNSSDYEYSLTITAVVEVNGELMGADGDMVGAFVNGECRGVADAVFNSTYNKYFFFLTVFSNQYSGEEVSFEYFNKADDKIYVEFITIEFQDGQNMGSASSPYKITNSGVKRNISISSDTISENNLAPSLIGRLNTNTDVAGTTFNYVISDADSLNNAWFYIKGDSLITDSVFNYEINHLFEVSLFSYSSNNDTLYKKFTIKVLDIEERSIVLSANTIDENNDTPLFIGALEVIDTESQLSYTLSLTDAADNDYFYILNDSLYTDSVFNFENKESYLLGLQAVSELNDTLFADFDINIINIIEQGEFFISNNEVTENSTAGTFIGTVAVNYDADDLSFIITKDILFTDWEHFLLRNDSVFSAEAFNYEEQNSYELGFKIVSSAADTTKETVNIIVIDEEETTTLSLSNLLVNENNETPTFIGVLSVKSEINSTYLYELPNTFDNNAFYLVADSLFTDSVFNYQIKDKYTIEVKAYSDYDTVLNTFVIEVVNQLIYGEVQLVNNEINENQGENAFISKLTVAGMDTTTVGYQFYVVDFNNGIFYLQNDSLFVKESLNHEVQKEYALTFYFIENANYDTTKTFATINVLDINDVPYNLTISNDTISENMPIGTFVAKIFVDDEDINDTITFEQTIPTGGFEQVFEIKGDSIFTTSVLDYESNEQHSIAIIATDKAGAQISMVFEIKVNDVIESSVFDKKEALGLNIYPNPVRDMLTIKTLNHIGNTTIYNVVGRVVYNSGSDIKTVDVSTLQKGVYFIEVSILNKRHITQFIKE